MRMSERTFRRAVRSAVLSVVVLASAARPASAYSIATTEAFLPAVHVVGASGVFRTDVEVYNPDPERQAEVLFYLTPPDSDYTKLPGIRLDQPLRPLAAVSLPDIVLGFFGFDNAFGSLNVLSRDVADSTKEGPALLVTSNTYNVAGALAGTYGQFSPGQPYRKAIGFDDSVYGDLYLIGLKNDPTFRTNVGIMNTEAVPLEVGVQLRDSVGQPYGTRIYSVAPFSIRQINDIFEKEFASAGAPRDRGPYRLVVFVNLKNGAKVLCYASVTDLRTGDPYLITGEPLAP